MKISIGIVYWTSSSRFSSFVHHVVRDVRLDAKEKLFVLTTFSRFIGQELLDKKLTNLLFICIVSPLCYLQF